MASALALDILILALPVAFLATLGIWGGIKVAARWYGAINISREDSMRQVAEALRDVAGAIRETTPPTVTLGLDPRVQVGPAAEAGDA